MDADNTTNLDIVRHMAEQVLRRAAELGVVLTIELEPQKPLAMRNYVPVVHARMRR